MSNVNAHDLRSEAKDFARDKAHKTKWSRGARPSGRTRCMRGIDCNGCDECNVLPNNRDTSRNFTSLRQSEHRRAAARDSTMTKKAFRGSVVEAADDTHDGLSDSSGDFDVDETSAAPELHEVMYSFDAQTGPSQGSEIFSYALTQAVQRYENNETEKIVKKEYDLVLDGKDEPESYVADADDDFELIDGTHLA